MKQISITILAILLTVTGVQAKSYKLSSPDGTTKVSVNIDRHITYAVTYKGVEVLTPSTINMSVNGKDFAKFPTVTKAKTTKVAKTTPANLYKRSSINECYNQLDISFKEGFGVIFRAYDNEGVAYRFYHTGLEAGDVVNSELAEFNFGMNYHAYVPYCNVESDNQKATSFENVYEYMQINDWQYERLAFSPVLVCLDEGVKLAITEADIEAYPGMFLKKNNSKKLALIGEFANIPSKTVKKGRKDVVETYSPDMAKIRTNASKKSPHYFPWRVLAISGKDSQLIENNLVYLLASPNRLGDVSWVKPGKVAWDWWNDWNLAGVDFKAGINTETYKYYIDFASANGIEYVVLDEGWSDTFDVMSIKDCINLKEIIDYGKKKNVGIILWMVAYSLNEKLDEACKTYSAMGVRGFKIDFIDRDDQIAVEMLYTIARTAAKHHLLVDYHGTYKPAGMNRTFPNVINFEGIFGLEQMKWVAKECDMVRHEVLFPFIRMVSGPVDFTQGAMRNSTKGNYYPCYSNPMSQGTRARQVAEYVIFDSPLAMLCDSPTAYQKEQETTNFIVSFPTVWDETKVLDAEVGKYIITARRSGNKWYVGGITDWEARDITLDLSFIGNGRTAEIYRDGINSEKNASDYKVERVTLGNNVKVHMAPGGGFAIIAE